jgi:hypothetical protein
LYLKTVLSLFTVLGEKEKFKVFDVTADKRAHISEFLDRIPDKKYSNLNELMDELRIVL